MKNLWALIRPYFTVARVTTALTAVVTPIAAVVIAWLAVQLAKVGIDLNQTQALVAFGTVFAGVIATVVPLVRKFLDNRTQFEVAMIQQGKEDQIGGKSLSSQKGTVIPDEAYLLSESEDIADDDADLA